MSEMPISDAREHLSEVVGRARYGGEETILTHYGSPSAVVIRSAEVCPMSQHSRWRGAEDREPERWRDQPESLWRRADRRVVMAGEQCADWMVGELVADDPAVALRGDDLAGTKVPQRLRDRGVLEAGGDGEVGDADRPCGVDADEQHEPGRISEHSEMLSQCADRYGIAESGDGLADLFAVDDALVCAVGRDEVHDPSLPLVKI